MKNVSFLTFVFAITLFFSFSSARYAIANEKSASTASTQGSVTNNEQKAERGLSSEKGTTAVQNEEEQVKRPYRHIGRLSGD